ncbi:hypothetical protein KAS79_00730 [Candidatus Parcubacteria bacterium]|nr:hypothetical protein [Candidatus Parcubacteria bacterium]
MELRNLIERATIAGLIKWEPTEEQEVRENGRIMRGYKANVGNFEIRTIVRKTKKKSFWGPTFVYGVAIKDNSGREKILTSDPKELPGKKEEYICVIVWGVQHEVENKDLLTAIKQQLAQMTMS